MATLVKYGDAIGLDFGTADLETDWGFKIVESMSGESSYSTEITLKNHTGDTVGLILGDSRTTGTVAGIASSAGMTYGLGDIADNPTAVGNQDSGGCIITSVRVNYSNEDFVKYELGFSAWDGVNPSGSSS